MAQIIDAVDVHEMAEKLEVTARAVRKMIHRGDIRAEKIGRSWAIPGPEVLRVQKERKAA